MASKKQLITEADVRRMAPGVRELILGDQRIATPAALDLAFARGMKVVYGEVDGSGPSGPIPSDLWQRMKSQDGTYVVQIESGRATVSRLGAGGPELFGSEG
ncbi:hypothetical protein Poly30_20270 [Planctomycetes bacterium Poly30]|uniref:Uncharacterized protein n=1 Tax=Saltatorellus ferox TaxID=2528018 RepID=A0A518EQZ9_9BACT|nr:hypothetical protein Poly30_20270 [Planctomycetes bacterium Poly30]